MIELVWDAKRLGTATAPSGASVTVGDCADFAPEDLLAMAAAGSVMRTFLELAERREVPILSYAATAHVEPASEGLRPRVAVRSFVVASEDVQRSDIMRLLEEATAASPVCRMLGDRVTHWLDIQCLCGACAS